MTRVKPWHLPVGVLAIAGSAAAILRASGRVWWCKCGEWVPYSLDIWSRHNSQHLLDPYSFSHAIHGFLFYAGLRLPVIAKRVALPHRALLAVGLEAAWELLENSPIIIDRYRSVTASLDYTGDSVLNSMSDIACAGVGFALAARLPVWASVLFVVAAEVGCALWIRDNLTLNVLMLLYPIAAVREWQSAIAP